MAAPKKAGKKAQYYVMYLGWKECRGVAGREFTEPIVKDLIRKRSTDYLPKLTLEVSKKEIKINQIIEKDQKGKPKQDKRKYPPIPTKDVTYAVQALSPDEDTVACIYLGFNPRTQCAVHVHVYKCDSTQTANSLVNQINQTIANPEHQKRVAKIETELANKGQLVGRSANEDRTESGSETNSNGGSDHRDMRLPRVPIVENPQSPPPLQAPHPHNGFQYPQDYPHYPQEYPPSDYPLQDEESIKEEQDREIAQTLADEFKQRLQGGIKSPMLVPPKDYDTVRVTKDYDSRRWRPLDAQNPEQSRSPQHSRGNSYDDSARGESEGSQRSSGLSQTDYNQAVDSQVFSQFELRGGDGVKPRDNVRNRGDTRVADKYDQQFSPIEYDASKPSWAKDLYNDTRKPQPNGYAKDSRNEVSYGQRSENSNVADNDIHPKVPHWKRSENYYHQEQAVPNPRTVVYEPPARPMSPMPMVPYDDWLSQPSRPDYLSDNRNEMSSEHPVSPRGQYRPQDMQPQDSYDPYLKPKQANKYNPVSLGLVSHEPRSPRGRHPDEGYRSIDPHDFGGRYPMEDPRNYPMHDPRGYPSSPRGLDQHSPDLNLSASLDSKDRKKKNKKEKYKR